MVVRPPPGATSPAYWRERLGRYPSTDPSATLIAAGSDGDERATRLNNENGTRLTFSDVDAGLPYGRLTGDAAEFVRTTIQS